MKALNQQPNGASTMTFQQAITADLIASIVSKCEVSTEQAAKMLKNAKTTAKMIGLPLADTLVHLGMV
jgi:hypothetical protein